MRVMGQRVLFEETRLEVGRTYSILVYPKLPHWELVERRERQPYRHEARLLHIFERRRALEKYLQLDEWGTWLKVQEIQEGFVQILHFERLIVMVRHLENNWVRFPMSSAKAKRLLKQVQATEEVEGVV
jgi:hypothetical protein